MFTSAHLTYVNLQSAIIRHPLVVSPDTTVQEAIAQMSGVQSLCETTRNPHGHLNELELKVRSSCVVVIEDRQVVGILTERDVVRFLARQQSLENFAIRQAMAHPVITHKEKTFTDLFLAIDLLQQHQIRHLPIVDDREHLVGLVTHESLRQLATPIDLLRLRLVQEVMNTKVICAFAQDSMLWIAQQMAQHQISSVVIIKLDSLTNLPIPLGILTERDLVQFQALALNLEDCTAEMVMSTPIFTVSSEQSLWRVQQLMQQHFIHRVVVTGEQGELLGIVTQTSLLQALNPLELYKLAGVLEKKVVYLEAEKLALLENRTIALERQVEARTVVLEAKAEREKLLADLATQIRSSLSLQTILETTVEQVRFVLGCDRVNICQLKDNGSTLVVAESTHSPLSLVGESIYDSCFQQEIVEIYRQGYIRVVPDIYTTKMTDCHRQMLIRLHTRAKILVPLLCGDRLWGLLNVTESYAPRNWQVEEVELLRALSVQLAIALQQAIAHERLQEELQVREATETLLRESEQRYASLIAAAPVGIFRSDAIDNCIYVNDRWCQMAGLSPESALGQGWHSGLHPDDLPEVLHQWSQFVEDRRPFRLEYRFQRPDGQITWVYGQAATERDHQGNVIGYVRTITDISDRKQAEMERLQTAEQLATLNQDLEQRIAKRTASLQTALDKLQTEIMERELLEEHLRVANQQLEHLAQTDGLTHLANRRHFDRRLQQEWQHLQRNPHPLSLIMLDVDYFKRYNDYYGHPRGDECLLEIAQAIQRAVSRSTDLVARYGGEEFVVLLPYTDQEGAIKMVQAIQSEIAALALSHPLSEISHFVTISAGVSSLFPSEKSEKTSPQVLIDRADRALYEAKSQGRNCYTVYS